MRIITTIGLAILVSGSIVMTASAIGGDAQSGEFDLANLISSCNISSPDEVKLNIVAWTVQPIIDHGTITGSRAADINKDTPVISKTSSSYNNYAFSFNYTGYNLQTFKVTLLDANSQCDKKFIYIYNYHVVGDGIMPAQEFGTCTGSLYNKDDSLVYGDPNYPSVWCTTQEQA